MAVRLTSSADEQWMAEARFEKFLPVPGFVTKGEHPEMWLVSAADADAEAVTEAKKTMGKKTARKTRRRSRSLQFGRRRMFPIIVDGRGSGSALRNVSEEQILKKKI